jgi:quinol monooxygenase YgiN
MKKTINLVLAVCALNAVLLLSSCCGGSGNSNEKAKCCEAKKCTGNEKVIVAHVAVQPEAVEELTAAFQTIVEATRKEEGNISYVLYQDISDPLNFTFVEVWASQEAINTHNASDHFKAFVAKIEGKADLDVFTLKKKF